MTFGFGNCGFTCESQCPPHHVAIQPPPFCITIPGPVMTCSDDSCAVTGDAPCCGYGGWGYGGWGGNGGWGGYGGCGGYGGYGGFGGYGGWGGRGWGGYGGCCGGYGGWGGFGGFGGRRSGCCGW